MASKTKTATSELTAGAEAIAFTKKTFVFDCTSLFYVLDEPYTERCLEAGVNATNTTFASEANWDSTLAVFETGLEKIEKSRYLTQATCVADIEKAREDGKLAVIVGTQGATMVEKELWRVKFMWRLGLRYIGLAYSFGNLLADGCVETRDGGLTFLGKDFIAAVNELPMLLDLAHCGHQTRAEATELARAPVCTHSNSYTVNANDRNTKDETAVAIAKKGGVIGLCSLPRPVWPEDPTVEHLIDHCDHWAELIGVEHVGLGLDFVEALKDQKVLLPETIRNRTLRPDIFGSVDDFQTQNYPRGLDSIRLLPNLTQGLFDRGYSKERVAAILGGNWLGNFKRVVG